MAATALKSSSGRSTHCAIHDNRLQCQEYSSAVNGVHGGLADTEIPSETSCCDKHVVSGNNKVGGDTRPMNKQDTTRGKDSGIPHQTRVFGFPIRVPIQDKNQCACSETQTNESQRTGRLNATVFKSAIELSDKRVVESRVPEQILPGEQAFVRHYGSAARGRIREPSTGNPASILGIDSGNSTLVSDNYCGRPALVSDDDSDQSVLRHAWLNCGRGENSKADRLVGLTLHCVLLSLMVMGGLLLKWAMVAVRFLVYMAMHTAVYKGRVLPIREDAGEPVTREQLQDATVFDSTGLRIVLLQYHPPRLRSIEAPASHSSVEGERSRNSSTFTKTYISNNSGSNNLRPGPSEWRPGCKGGRGGNSGPHMLKSTSSHSGSYEDLSHIFSSSTT